MVQQLAFPRISSYKFGESLHSVHFFIFSVKIRPVIFSYGILPHLLETSLPKPAVLLLQTGLPTVQLAFRLLPALPVPCLLYQLDPYNIGLTLKWLVQKRYTEGNFLSVCRSENCFYSVLKLDQWVGWVQNPRYKFLSAIWRSAIPKHLILPMRNLTWVWFFFLS